MSSAEESNWKPPRRAVNADHYSTIRVTIMRGPKRSAGTLYFRVRFKDKTDFSLRYACDMFVVGADFCDFKTGDFEMIHEYMKPIPR